ncbi:MAG: hypothetical protein ACRD5R_14025 [Candidatus Acidiferrales bacterium]
MLLLFVLCAVSLPSAAQNSTDTPGEEIIANLAAGRVILCVAKNAILIGTIEDPIEAQTHVPAPVALAGRRAGVVLGAVDWFSPSSRLQFARLDLELPQLRPRIGGASPHLQAPSAGVEARDIEAIGQGVLDRLGDIAQLLHGKIDVPENQPIVQVVLADYLEDYGPEIWELSYSLDQEIQQTDYWNTRFERPVYLQYFPPEKGQPHTLVEFKYPPDDASPALLDLLRQNDPRLATIRSSDAKLGEVAQMLLDGESTKIPSEDALQFLRASIEAIALPKARITMGIVRPDSGFEWILRPPPEPKPALRPANPNREPGAPSLLNP